MLIELVTDGGGGQRAQLGLFVHRISNADLRHPGGEFLQELVVDLFVNDESLGGDARLAVVDHARRHRRRHSGLQVRAGHHDEGIAAAELDDRLLEILSSGAGD